MKMHQHKDKNGRPHGKPHDITVYHTSNIRREEHNNSCGLLTKYHQEKGGNKTAPVPAPVAVVMKHKPLSKTELFTYVIKCEEYTSLRDQLNRAGITITRITPSFVAGRMHDSFVIETRDLSIKEN